MRCTANSMPTAPTNHPICSERFSDLSRRQKAAIRYRISLLDGTYGSVPPVVQGVNQPNCISGEHRCRCRAPLGTRRCLL